MTLVAAYPCSVRHSTAASRSFVRVASRRSAWVRRTVGSRGAVVMVDHCATRASRLTSSTAGFIFDVMPERPTQHERALRFRALHSGDRPLQLANAWDPLSAAVMAAAGAPAIGTTSFGVALAHGVWDAELVRFADVLAMVDALSSRVDVPVTVDLEAGRGAAPPDVQRSVAAVIDRGAVGVNIEDTIPDQQGHLRDVDDQAARLRAARDAATASGIPIFINARCDVWFGADLPTEARL